MASTLRSPSLAATRAASRAPVIQPSVSLISESRFADPANTFHEKAALCRAAENTCFFATVNSASAGSPTTSAVVRPDGTLQCHQPYGEERLLVTDIDTTQATGLLAARYRPLDRV